MELPVEKRKFALAHASIVITYYIKLLCTGADRHNGILLSLLLLVTETIRAVFHITIKFEYKKPWSKPRRVF